MNFKKGQRFRVKSNGALGTVVDVSFNSIYQEYEYYITWDNWPQKGSVCYNANDGDKFWEAIDAIQNQSIDPGILPIGSHGATGHYNGKGYDSDEFEYGMYGHDSLTPKASDLNTCDHKWVDVGFNHSKIVCANCNTEQK